MLAACQPKVVEVEKVVTQEVVKEVEKVIKETIVVEKEVQAPEPVTGPIEIVGWSVNGMNPDAPSGTTIGRPSSPSWRTRCPA